MVNQFFEIQNSQVKIDNQIISLGIYLLDYKSYLQIKPFISKVNQLKQRFLYFSYKYPTSQSFQDIMMIQQELLNKKYRIIHSEKSKAGVYGIVNKAINIQTNQLVALKQLKQRVGVQGLDATVIRESSILKVMGNNHNIVQLIQTFRLNDRIFLVFPYIDTSLRDFMKNQPNDNIPPKIVKEIMKQLLSAIRAAHTKRFMHRDIKPQNILVLKSKDNPQNFVLKLADWGSSRKLNTGPNQNFTEEVIPPAYKPPQLLFGTTKYTQTVDIWSVGCLFAQLLFGERIFDGRCAEQLLIKIIEKVGLSQAQDYDWVIKKYKQKQLQQDYLNLQKFKTIHLDELFQKKDAKLIAACDLLKKMLRLTPDKRISAIDASNHHYFDFNN